MSGSEMGYVQARLTELAKGQSELMRAMGRVEGGLKEVGQRLSRVEEQLRAHAEKLDGGAMSGPGLQQRVYLLEQREEAIAWRYRMAVRAMVGAVLTFIASALATVIGWLLRA